MDGWNWSLLIFCCVLASEAQIPSFTLNPQGGVYGQGAPVTLRCTASGSVSYIAWVRNDLVTTTIITGGTLTVTNGTLTIPLLTAEQSGNYRCLAVGTGGVNVTSSVALIQIIDIQGDPNYSTDSGNPTLLTVNGSQPFVTEACGTYTSTTSVITYEWKLSSGNNIPDLHKTVPLLNGSLLLQNSSGLNNGQVYKCQATVAALLGTQISRVGYVRIQVIMSQGAVPATPVLIVQPRSLVVNPGEDAKFLCASAGGSNPGSVSWASQTVNGANTNLMTNIYVDSSHVDAVVSFVNSGNEGNYTCTGPNGISFSSVLTVRSPPVIDAANSLALARPVYLYGVNFTLSCIASGNELKWLWYHNGKRLSASGNTVTVPSPTLDDSGVYQCFAYNPVSYDSAIGNITIQTLPATFTNGSGLSNSIAFSGQRYEFACKAQGAPAPTYQWYKDGTVLSGSSTFTVDAVRGTLTVNNVEPSVIGNYTCVATNRIQSGDLGSVSSSAKLTVISPTTITQSLPVTLSIEAGDAVTLPCLATSSVSDTQLTYSWTKDNSPLNVMGRLSNTGAGGSIAISSVQMSDAGLYQCTVNTTLLSNPEFPPVSLKTDPSQITVSDTPVRPATTLVTALNSTAITVSWTYSGLPAKLNFFLVQVMVVGSDVWTNSSAISQNSITMATVGSLTPFTTYEVRVAAVLNDGSLVGSKVSTAMTLQAAPSEAPSGLVATPIGTSELQLTWKAPSKSGSNGILTDYCVQYREEGSNVPYTEVYVGSNDTMYLLTGLKALFSYEIRVAANTSIGRGPFTTAIVTTAYSLGDASFPETVGFIAMLVGIGLFVAAVLMIVFAVCVWRRHHRTKIYRVKSGTFMSTEDVHLERDIIQDYEMRGQKFQLQLQQNGMETDGASCSESVHTTQTGGSSSYMLQAPAYINPPSFEEFSKRSRAYSRERLNDDLQDNVIKDPGFLRITDSQSGSKQHLEPQETGFRVRTHSQSSSKQQFEQETAFRTVSKQQYEHESDEDVSVEKPSLTSTPSDSDGALNNQLQGKMAQAIATGTFV